MVRWHHQLNGHELEQTLGSSGGQGSLACCSLWGHRVRYDLATEQQLLKMLEENTFVGKESLYSLFLELYSSDLALVFKEKTCSQCQWAHACWSVLTKYHA